jgi:DNA polymerase-4
MKDRIIFHLDLNAFFASVEQTANPFLRGKPVGVTGNPDYPGSAILAASYAAKRRGVKGIMRVRDAKVVCPEIILVPFDPLKYYAVNQKIMKIFKEYTPQLEIYSIDEAFLDMTDVMHLYNKTPVELAQEIKDRIRHEVGEPLTSSVGIAPNKLLAKIGSDWKKPDGLTVITWENRFEYLDQIPIQDIWGIGYHAGPKLRALGINSTKQIRELDDATLRSIVGSYYTRLRAIANGEHFDPVDPKRTEKAAKSMQHAHTLSKSTNDPEELKSVIRKMSERLAIRLRRHKQQARVVYLGLRPEKMQTYGWGSLPRFSGFHALPLSTTHGKDIYDAALEIFNDFDISDTKIRLIAVGVNDLDSTSKLAFDIFMNPKITALDKAVDEVNSIYGSFTVRYGDILHQKAKDSELKVERPNMTFHPTSE